MNLPSSVATWLHTEPAACQSWDWCTSLSTLKPTKAERGPQVCQSELTQGCTARPPPPASPGTPPTSPPHEAGFLGTPGRGGEFGWPPPPASPVLPRLRGGEFAWP